MIEPDVVLMLPESYELPENVGFDALFMLDEPKTAKTLTQHELDILKKCIPTMKKFDYDSESMINLRAHVLRLKDTKEVIERYNVMEFPYLRMTILPDGLKHIEHEAFRDFNLEYIHIPKSVQYIGSKAFIGCTFAKENFVNDSALDGEKNGYWGAKIVDEEIDGMLIKDNEIVCVREGLYDSFDIPNTVTRIGKEVFHNSDLTSITIPNSVTYIGESAFLSCCSLTSVTIGNSVTSIEDMAFYDCDNLTKIICQALTPPKIGEESIDSVCQPTIYVPQGAVAAYQADAEWGKFNIQAIP